MRFVEARLNISSDLRALENIDEYRQVELFGEMARRCRAGYGHRLVAGENVDAQGDLRRVTQDRDC